MRSWRFGPPLVLMAVIFALSAQPSLRTELGTLDLIGRKIVHMFEYGLLWLLWLRALPWRWPSGALAAAAIALLYAASDEWHQTFVTGRTGTPRDWLIDATGVALAALVVGLRRRRRRRRRQLEPALSDGPAASTRSEPATL